ncbi:MAG: sensor domain-containing diguanylate cyclase [Zoogloeaceae bacterium]|nr:sensor domain-containing diguanylate cyclase [Zoogloeaceae bacterium]
MGTNKISAMILEAFPVASFVIDTEHRVINWNRACEILTNVSRQSIVGTKNQWQPFYSSPRMVMADVVLRNPEDKDADSLYRGKLRPSQAIPGTYEAEDFFPTLGSNGRWLYFTAAPLRDEEGVVIGAIETLQDITDRRLAEDALKESEARFKTLSRTDSLTQLFNFRDFYEQLEHEVDRAARYARPLSLVIVDIDHFKTINDTHGHIEGDRVLRQLGELILGWKRTSDKAFRYGGDEFAILMPEARHKQAVEAAERLLRRLAALPPEEDGSIKRCTLSIGVSEYVPGEKPIDLVRRTDAAAYQAKKSGRNRVVGNTPNLKSDPRSVPGK